MISRVPGLSVGADRGGILLSKLPLSSSIVSTLQNLASESKIPLQDVVSQLSHQFDSCTTLQHTLQEWTTSSLPSSTVFSPSLPSSPKCSLGGYFQALVDGFTREDESTILAADASNAFAGSMETAREEIGGHLGLFLFPRITNVHESVTSYHRNCRSD